MQKTGGRPAGKQHGGRCGNCFGQKTRNLHKKRCGKGAGDQPDNLWAVIETDGWKRADCPGRKKQKYTLSPCEINKWILGKRGLNGSRFFYGAAGGRTF